MDGAADLRRERQAAKLIIYHFGTDPAVGQRCHGAYEIVAVADNPAGSQQVVRRQRSDQCVTGCLGLTVDTERGERLGFGVQLY